MEKMNTLIASYMAFAGLECPSQINYDGDHFTAFAAGWNNLVERLSNDAMHRVLAQKYGISSVAVDGLMHDAVNYNDD